MVWRVVSKGYHSLLDIKSKNIFTKWSLAWYFPVYIDGSVTRGDMCIVQIQTAEFPRETDMSVEDKVRF